MEKPYKMEPNIEAALSYIPIVGVFVFFMEKEDKFVRFHAMQSILYWVAIVVIGSVVRTLFGYFYMGLSLMRILQTAATIVWLFLMWKAYNKEEYELPVVGKIAKDQVK